MRVEEIPTLETERLILRAFAERDLDDYARMCADPELMRFLGGPVGRDDAWRSMAMFLGHWHLRGFGLWAAEERSSGRLVGRIGLHRPEGWPALEVGWMVDRARWGEGFATEGARASLDYARRVLRVEDVISLIEAENVASIRVAEKLGAATDGTAAPRGVLVQVYRYPEGA